MKDKSECSPPEVVLFDADLWTYDIAFAAEPRGSTGPLSFDYCKDFVDIRFEEIMEKLNCSEYKMYLTGEGNFRHDLATIREYKGNRKQPRPFHYNNIREYLKFKYNAEVINGMEADDAMSIEQASQGDKSVIVSRDKDLRMCPGWHYSYAVGNQKEKPLEYITPLGYISEDGKTGGGLKWFYTQCIVGDSTDNIQGLPKGGPKLAVKTLSELDTEPLMYSAVLDLYRGVFEDEAEEKLLENARLLWMVNELDEQGEPVMWEPPVHDAGIELS